MKRRMLKAASFLTATAMASMMGANVYAEEGKMDELTHIIVAITCPNPSEDTKLVEEAINEISIPAINVEIELKDISIVDALYSSYFTLAISGREQFDLIQLPYIDLTSYADSFLIDPMDELLEEYAPTIMAAAEEYPILDAGTILGEVYGVDPIMRTYGTQASVIVRKDYMDEAGIAPDKDIYTYEDLSEIFAAIKENHPDVYPYTFASLNMSSVSFFTEIDTLGVNAYAVLAGTDSTEVVNMFDSEAYKEHIKYMREWYEAGYIMPDAATTDLTCTDLLISGKCAAANSYNTPDNEEYSATAYAHEFYSLPTTSNYIGSTGHGGSIHWSLPVTSESPEAAIRFLNLLYEDSRIAQLMYSGIEETHYVVNEDGTISYPEGITYETAKYQNGWDAFGDTRELKYYTSYDKEAAEAYTAANLSNPTKAVGFCADVTDYTAEIMAIDAIVAQYVNALETGSVEDYEGIRQEMVNKMNAAGMEDVIVEIQSQFDAWLAE